jgi:DNA-binding transcriptional ArsR family regulator
VDGIFNALGDPTRIAIVEELSQRDNQTLFELCTRLIGSRGLSMSRQAIAKHLGVLRDAGLVKIRTVGRTSVHTLNRAVLSGATTWLSTLAANERDTRA